MVEFNGKIRFYYIFRLTYFSSFASILQDMFHLDPLHIDAVVYDKAGGRPDVIAKLVSHAAHWIDYGSVIGTMAAQQYRDAGHFFSEKNPYTYANSSLKVDHSCMPGAADDEYALLLFLLRYRLRLAGDESHYYAPLR